VAKVREALASLPGVKNVQVDFKNKQATLTVETEKFDDKAVGPALEKAGFGGKISK
jgi:copper chaperone CopZ